MLWMYLLDSIYCRRVIEWLILTAHSDAHIQSSHSLITILFRILGGIGVVAPWWPIKAYRPCPNFIDRGGVYQRSGQGLDEIAFGRDSSYDGER